MLEKNGVRIAAVSYDSQEILRGFADKHGIGFPLLSDHDSAVIRRFGIFNTNIAPGLRAHGVPHPVEYLVAPDGKLIRKYFVENYQHRVTASAVVLHEFGVVGEQAPMITLQSGALTLEIGLSGAERVCGPGDRLVCEVQAGAWLAHLRHASAGPLHGHVNYLRRSESHTAIL